MKYPHRYYLFAPADALPAMRSLLCEIWPCDPADCPNAFDTPLADAADAKGATVLHCGSFPATDEHCLAWEKATLPDGVKLVRVEVVGTVEDKIKEATDAGNKAKIGQPWDTKSRLAAMGFTFKLSDAVVKPADPKEAEIAVK